LPGFDLDIFIGELRAAARGEDPARAVRRLMTDAFRDVDAVREAMAGFSGEEEVLFEDDSVSIWYCGFDPRKHVPPHDHQTTATIGVYAGRENNHFYTTGKDGLERRSTRSVAPGEVIAIGPQAIHSVETADGEFSYAIHVYLGPLTTIERSLFDWDSGAALPFNDENYARLERPSEAGAAS
jgi:predicted metal-dependent enzyme (double-stranded beta helix superfamily)